MDKIELKPCKSCNVVPDFQSGLDFGTLQERYRYCCPQCHTTTKSMYSMWGAIEEWNKNN
jgi:hypothetical protein